MSIQLQPPVPLVPLVKTEPLTVIKNESPEEALEKEISPDFKDIDIVYHSLSEDLKKNEIVLENILETKYSESVETQVLVKTEDTSNENVPRGTGQEVIEVKDSNEYSNVLNNLETDTQLVLNFSKDLNGSSRARKGKQPEKTYFAKCYKTVETTSWKKDKEKIKVIKAPVIPVEAHEYTSLAEYGYVCSHCQHACNKLKNLNLHIRKMHREVTTMYQCPYCSYKSKWSVREHIIQKHKDTKDIQRFQCNFPEMKFKLKSKLTQHMKVHLKHKQMKDGLDLQKRQLQPSVPLVTLIKTEPPTVIKNEPPEEALEKEISPDTKDIDIVYHSLSEDLIKSETVPENKFETKYSESVEIQVLVKTEDISDENVTRGTDQEVIEVQGSNEYSNVLSNPETDAQLVLKVSKDLNDISTRTRKAKQPEKTNFAKCYKTIETTSWKKDIEKIKVIKAPVIPIQAHEYTSLAEDKYVCNHCQHAYNALSSLGRHINHKHRKLTTMYQCPYCPFKSKWSVKRHIILKHKGTKDIQWFQCNFCEMKCKLKASLTQHMMIHLTHEQMQDLKSYHCNNCNYKTYRHPDFKRHNLVHLKSKEIQYFYCYHCSFKSKQKSDLKNHMFSHHFKNV